MRHRKASQKDVDGCELRFCLHFYLHIAGRGPGKCWVITLEETFLSLKTNLVSCIGAVITFSVSSFTNLLPRTQMARKICIQNHMTRHK